MLPVRIYRMGQTRIETDYSSLRKSIHCFGVLVPLIRLKKPLSSGLKLNANCDKAEQIVLEIQQN